MTNSGSMAPERFGPAAAAMRHPDRIAVTDYLGATLTYVEFDARVNRLIHVLRDHGLTAGGVFAVLSENRTDVVVAHHAAFRGGFYFCPLNPKLRADETSYILGDSGAAVLLADGVHRELLEQVDVPDGVATIWFDDVGDDDELVLEGLLAGASDARVPHGYGSVLSYTSGTTGRPKGVLRELTKPTPAQAEAMMAFGLGVGYDAVHDRHLVTAPLSHGGPMVSAMHCMNLGGTVVVMGRFDPEALLACIDEHRITSTYMVPTMYHRLLRLDETVRAQFDLSSLRSVVHTGAPCPPALKARMLEWLGPIVYECYAATEGLGTFTVCTPMDAIEHPGTVGRPPDGLISIRDEAGHPVPTGTAGRVHARTLPGVSPFRYKGDDEKTASAYAADGTYHVGDLGYLDDEGYLYLTGRSTDMIITGGVNVYPAEVEGVLLRHPDILDVAVLGVEDDDWGERVVAIVQVASDNDVPAGARADRLAGEIVAFAKQSLASYKCPKEVRFVGDLGRDPSGKLRKHRLREQLG